MNREKIIWIKIDAQSYYNLLIKLNDIGVTVYDNKKNKNDILIKTSYSDYKKIKKYLVSYKTEIIGNSGFRKILDIIKKYIFFSVGVILSIILLFLVNNLIFKIEIKSPNKNVQKLVMKELEKNGIKKLTLKKKHSEIEKIVNKILNDNKNTLEWLEIKYSGLVLIVNVTEKTVKEETTNYKNCNIIASTDAKITSLNIYRGVALKEINDYVLKGDIILSGTITHNEEIKNTVCASGEIYGEVWYTVNITVPFKEVKTKYTGKNRYNFNVVINENKFPIFKSRIKNKKEEITNLYKLNDFEINLVKEKEYILDTNYLTEEEAYNKGLKLALEKIKLTLDEEEEILLKKVLKKEVNDSTIYLEIFIVTKENIGILDKVEEVPNVQSNPESVQ